MIPTFRAPEIAPAAYRVKRKIGAAAENRRMPGPQHRAQQPNDTRNRAKSTDVAVYPLTVFGDLSRGPILFMGGG